MTATCYFVKQVTGATATMVNDDNDGVVLKEAIDGGDIDALL